MHIALIPSIYRERVYREEERRIAAVMIQAVVRGFVARRRVKKAYKTLQRQRAIRIRAKRNNASLTVQV
ncbi:hypothetical protein EON64_08905 [archaeon]|nr:MAG: hypothetical protein EON64_08905 [archaeon]